MADERETGRPLDREDLILFMEANKNTVEILTILHLQQKNILEIEEKNLQQNTKLNNEFEKLSNILKEREKIFDRILENLKENKGEILDSKKLIQVHRLDSTKERSEIKNRIYIALIGLAGIVLTVLLSAYGFFTKLQHFDLIVKIAKHLKVIE